MARKDVCEAPVCKTTKTETVCSVMVPVYGKGCRARRKSEFDSRSFRTIKSGRARIVIGCLKGNYDAKKRRCRTGTRAYQIIIPHSH